MNLQSDRIADMCRQLGLYAIPESWPVIAERHLTNERSYADFVETLLTEELTANTTRWRYALSFP